MRALITGAAGAVGLYLARDLAAHGYDLTLVDNLQRGKRDTAFEEMLRQPRVRFLPLDLLDPAAYQALGGEYDQVYHLAAVNGTGTFYDAPESVLKTNTLSLIYMLEWFREQSASGKFLFTSSNEAYAGALSAFGQLPLPTPEDVPLVIDDPYNPRWSYAGSKLIGELFTIHYAARYGLRAVIVRPHNFYGPRSGYSHVIPDLCNRIRLQTDPFPIYGTDDTRSFCYLPDAVEAMRRLMESAATDSQPIATVHIGSSEEVRIQELAERLFSIAEWRPSSIEVHASPQGSVRRRLPDISRIQAMVGWRPSTPLDEGLRATYAWYTEHPPASEMS